MNVFEDLIGELKDENLLEDTVIELNKNNAEDDSEGSFSDLAETEPSAEFELVGNSEVPKTSDDASSETATAHPDLPVIAKLANDREFFRKRAMEEVSSQVTPCES